MTMIAMVPPDMPESREKNLKISMWRNLPKEAKSKGEMILTFKMTYALRTQVLRPYRETS